MKRAEVEPEQGTSLGVAEPPSDKELVIRFKAGGSSAYDEIYRRYGRRVEQVCRRILNKSEDAEEAVQETFLKVYQGLPRFNGRYELGAWVARIATNVCLDQVRSTTRRPCDATPVERLESEAPVDLEPEAIVLSRARARTVRRVLAGLPESHRAAIVLRDFEGFSYDEIAEILDMSPTQVKALIHRARKGFRRSWVSVASSFFSLRLPRRLRDTSVATKERIAEVAGPTAPVAASSCTAIAQQCGTFLAERFVPIFAASMVGTAAVGSGVVLSQTPAPVSQQFEVQADGASVGRPFQRDALKMPHHKTKVAAVDKSVDDEGQPQDDAEVPEPAPSPTTPAEEPTPDVPDEPSEPPAEDPGTPKGGGEEPAEEQPEPTLPVTLPMVAFDQGQSMSGSAPTSASTQVDCAAETFHQKMTTMAGTRDGQVPADVTLSVGSGVSLELGVSKGGYDTAYVGGGGLVDKTRTDRYLTLDLAGSFGTGSDYAGAAGLPSGGSFRLHLILDCSDGSVTSQDLVLRGN